MNNALRWAPLAFLMVAGPLEADPPTPTAAPAVVTPNPIEKRLPPEILPKARPPAVREEPEPAGKPGVAPQAGPREDSPHSASSGSTTELVNQLTDADLSQIVPLLKTHYVSGDKLSETEIKRATIEGLLDRLKRGVHLLPASTPRPTEASPFRSEVLDNKLGYVRLGELTGETPRQLDESLKSFAEKRLPAVALDLRATESAVNFDLSAEVCRRFAPAGKLLFTVRRSHEKDQIYTSASGIPRHGLLVILTDRMTAGNGEIIAAVLQNIAHAMLIGSRTRGESAEFKDLPLAGGELLRVAVADVVLPNGAALSDDGVKPDLPVEVSDESTRAVLRQELDKGAAALVDETERAKMNEAALVAGTNPELDAMIAAQGSHDKTKQPARDPVLQRALDFVTTVTIYERNKQREAQ